MMDPQQSKMVLGTAQLGLDYGIANKTGRPDKETATAIIKAGYENGIREFDTAQAYGISEEILGYAFKQLKINEKVQVISKIHPDIDPIDRPRLFAAVKESCRRIGVPRLSILMLHDEALLDRWNQGISKALMQLVDQGMIAQLGVSVYSPARALEALEIDDISMIQLPANILDTRFKRAGVFALAREKGKKIYIRSIFLQGLLLMDPETLPERMAFAGPAVQMINQFAKELSISRVELAVCYLLQKYPRADLVFGAESPAQVWDTTGVAQRSFSKDIVKLIDSSIGDVPELVIRPDRWPQ